MANTYTSLHYHFVFSTKNREPWLTAPMRMGLWAYLGGIARKNRMVAREINGAIDHVHALVNLPPTISVSNAVQFLKGGLSMWMKNTFPEVRGFAWQDGYGAFTVSESEFGVVQEYIRNQAEHHRFKTFAEEYRAFLTRHNIVFDERYLLR
jgi:putative transposase